MNNKGFTLIEILMTIGIIALVTAITIPSIIYINKQIQKKNRTATEKLILNAAKMYGKDHKNELFALDEKMLECKIVQLSDLMEKGYYEVKNIQKLETDLGEEIDEYNIVLWLKNNTVLAEKYDINKTLPECKTIELPVEYNVLAGSPSNWVNNSDIKLNIKSNVEIKYWALVKNGVKATKNDYVKVATPNNEISVTKNLKFSGDYILWIKDMAYNIGKSEKILSITNIDSEAPSPPIIEKPSSVNNIISFKIKSLGEDTDSGIAKSNCVFADESGKKTVVSPSAGKCQSGELSYGQKYKVKLCSVDKAKNESCSNEYSIQLYYGLPNKQYNVGEIVDYSSNKWSIVEDSGTYLKLALNGYYGNGSYNNSLNILNTWFNDVINPIDIEKDVILEQNSGQVITTNSNYSGNAPGVTYWSDSKKIITPTNIYSISIPAMYRYYSYAQANGLGASVIYPSIYYSVRIPGGQSISSCETGCSYMFDNDSTTVIYYNSGVAGYANPSAYYANTYTKFHPTKYTSTTLNTQRTSYVINTSTGAISINTATSTFTNTEYFYLYICGGGSHGTKYTLSSSSQVGKYYSFAGSATSTVSGSSPRFKRSYVFYASSHCAYLPTSYKITDKIVPIYYRPYIWVYKQGFE